MVLSETEIYIHKIKENIQVNTNKNFNAQLLLFIGILKDNIPDIEYAVDNGADVNEPMSQPIQYVLHAMGLLEDPVDHHS